MKSWVSGLLLVAACGSPRADSPSPQTVPSPPRIVLVIADGAGAAYWAAAHFAADALAVHRFPVGGLVDVQSASQRIADSAASATSYASGVQTYNGAIGVGMDSVPAPTVLELAARRGMSTGLVATSRITHATPAAFAAHVPNRAMELEIARQMVEHDVTVVLGGGRSMFDQRTRPDSLDLLGAIRRDHAYVETATALRALRADTVEALFGLFARDHMPAAAARTPTLSEMTAAALAVLDRNPAGFFLMVEGSQPDWRGHDNAPLGLLTAEMLDVDQAIAVALAYREQHPETLIVVTGDHETGGLALQYDSLGALSAAYSSGGHTATLIPLFAIGPGAERFGGISSNDRVGRMLIEAVGR
jgi:alkaline phosphatase